MNIYHENGCFSLWEVSDLEKMPKTVAKKIVKLIGKNQHRTENEECITTFCDWLCERIAFFKVKAAEDKASEKQLKFLIGLAEVL